MSDPARKPSNGFQFLGKIKLFFDPFAFRDIENISFYLYQISAFIVVTYDVFDDLNWFPVFRPKIYFIVLQLFLNTQFTQ